MRLPHFTGFGKQAFTEPSLSPADEHNMVIILGSQRFQKGTQSTKVYVNLTVLFRMLLFYGAIKNHPEFWQMVAKDWGLVGAEESVETVRKIEKVFCDARYWSLQNETEQRFSLLVRLVDEWLLIRPWEQIQYSEEIDESAMSMTRTGWLRIRDYHVDVLMDTKHPGCLNDVELPSKIVTSLWEQDPELTSVYSFLAYILHSLNYKLTFLLRVYSALLQELNPKKKKTKKENETPAKQSLASKIKASLTKSSPRSPKSNKSNKSYMPKKSPQQWKFEKMTQTGVKRPSSALSADVWDIDTSPKKQKVAQVTRHDDSASWPFFRPISVPYTNKTGSKQNSSVAATIDPLPIAAVPNSNHFKLPPLSPAKQNRAAIATPSTAAISSQPLVSGQPPPLVQSNLLRFSTARPGAMGQVQQDLRAQLRRVSDQMDMRRREIDARVSMETTGYVPDVTTNYLPDMNGLVQQSASAGGHHQQQQQGMTAQEREMYVAILQALENRVVDLEKRLDEESKWARAMGRFLYDANEKSLASLRDVFAAVDTLQRTSSALLDGSEGRGAEDGS